MQSNDLMDDSELMSDDRELDNDLIGNFLVNYKEIFVQYKMLLF